MAFGIECVTELELCVAGIILSILIGFTAFCLCSTLLDWPFSSCQYDYFNNPWIEHQCERCINKKDVISQKLSMCKVLDGVQDEAESRFDDDDKWNCPGKLCKKGYYTFRDGYDGALTDWKNMHNLH